MKHIREAEDSGVSSRRSDSQSEVSTEREENQSQQCNCTNSDLSKRYARETNF